MTCSVPSLHNLSRLDGRSPVAKVDLWCIGCPFSSVGRSRRKFLNEFLNESFHEPYMYNTKNSELHKEYLTKLHKTKQMVLRELEPLRNLLQAHCIGYSYQQEYAQTAQICLVPVSFLVFAWFGLVPDSDRDLKRQTNSLSHTYIHTHNHQQEKAWAGFCGSSRNSTCSYCIWKQQHKQCL